MIINHRLDSSKDIDMQYLIEKFGVRYYAYFMFLLESFISESNEEFKLEDDINIFELSKKLYLKDVNDLYYVLNVFHKLGYLESDISPIVKGSTIKLYDVTYEYYTCAYYSDYEENFWNR